LGLYDLAERGLNALERRKKKNQERRELKEQQRREHRKKYAKTHAVLDSAKVKMGGIAKDLGKMATQPAPKKKGNKRKPGNFDFVIHKL